MNKLSTVLLSSLMLSTSINAFAGVQIGGTRVIYNEKDKEVSVQLRNPDDKAFLVQSWTETESGAADKTFAVTPPLFRLDAKQNNALRILFRGAPLAADRESLYWLNVKAIAASNSPEIKNQLQLSVKTRIKLIYRPSALGKSGPVESASGLKWRRSGNSLQVTNDSPYYMNFSALTVNGKPLENVTYVAPHASKLFALGSAQSSGKVEWKVFNDYGVASQAFQTNF
ncbi:long polar fimbrial chaperone LpfB [Enterobacterales bacterium CwR94]|nr:long polar fimbrial chaperone LpfB [Enterobacterales bacterium CwR94]